jgi:hypothetical protein
MATRIEAIAPALDAVTTVPLPKALRVQLRNEVVQAYKVISQIQKKNSGIKEQMEKAETKLNGEQDEQGKPLPTPASEDELKKLVEALNSLAGYLHRAGNQSGISPQQRQQYRLELLELRAQLRFNYYTTVAQSLYETQGHRAAAEPLTRLLHILRHTGPNTPATVKLYREAEALYHTFSIPNPQIDREEMQATGNGHMTAARGAGMAVARK